MTHSWMSRHWWKIAASTLALAVVTSIAGPLASAPASASDTLPVTSAQIQHVWLIILENKSYDETFTGLNNNSYLWQTLPSEGVLLQNYYGTGHSSMDNYISLVSGQGPSEDVQEDCSTANVPFGSNSTIVTTGSVGGASPNWNFGQVASLLGPNQALGTTAANTNGCTYPTNAATLFDQFNLAGVSWKGYAQDLGGAQPEGSTSWVNDSVPNRDDGPCGAPGSPSENPASNPTYLSGSHGYPTAGNLASGTATSGTTTSLTDTSQSWTSNQFQSVSGHTVYELQITGGTGAGEYATVTSNTSNTLSFAALATAPNSTSTYTVGIQDTSNFTSASLEAGTGSSNDPQYSDQYVAKHFPFPWFESLVGSYNPSTGATGPALTEPASGTNCDSNHIANLDSPTNGLVQDLQNNTVPNFSWITPNNCSDAHDTTCKGNNLSGAFGCLSGSGPTCVVNLNDPIYHPAGLPAFDPEATTPDNYTGGLYASDLFLTYYVPLIEDSSAFQHGLIDITFDEGEPSFTYSGNSFNNVLTSGPNGTGTTSPQASAPADAPTFGSPGTTAPGADSIYGAYDVAADAAGETISGSPVSVEPTGPNSTLGTDANGDQLYPGPGNNSFLDRPPKCSVATSGTATSGTTTSLTDTTQSWSVNAYAGDTMVITGGTGYGESATITGNTATTLSFGAIATAPDATSKYSVQVVSGNCVPGIALGGASTTSSSPRTDTVTGSDSSNVISYPNPASGNPSLVADDTGREITSITVGGTAIAYGTTAYNTDFPNGAYVGDVTDSGPLFPTNSGGPTVSASFQMVDDAGNPIDPPAVGNGLVTSVTLSGECDPATGALPSTCTSSSLTPDPIYDALDPTPGGGKAGSVLISPYITPGTVATVAYNHYSWLRTMEDLFDVSSCVGTPTDITLAAGTVCGGLDGQGHLG